MIQRFKFPAIVLVAILLSAALGYAAHASPLSALLTAGTTRYAVVSATNGVDTTSQTFVDIPNTTVWITVPQGQTADVLITFCGEMATSVNGGILIQGMIGTVLAIPGPYIVKQDEPLYATECVQFYKTGITAGNKAVKLQWKVPNLATGHMYDRSVIVTVNIH